MGDSVRHATHSKSLYLRKNFKFHSMKKTLTLFAAAISCGIASAQTESAFVKASNFDTSGTAITAGTEICKSDNVSMKVAFDCTYKSQAMVADADSYNAFVIGDESFFLAKGIQGTSDAKEVKLTELPAKGAVYQFDVTESGVLYVFSKLNTAKTYYVMNVASDKTFSVVAYSVSAFSADGVTNYAFTMPEADFAGFSNYTDGGNGKKYLSLAACYEEATGNEDMPAKADIKGVIAFPVTAGSYYVYAGGSKITSDGFVFAKGATEVATVSAATVAEPEPDPEPDQETPSTAVKNISISSLDSNAPIYNLLGQRVQKGYKGICIQNGKKFMVK